MNKMTKEELLKEIDRKIENVQNAKVSLNGELMKITVIEALRECKSLVEKLN